MPLTAKKLSSVLLKKCKTSRKKRDKGISSDSNRGSSSSWDEGTIEDARETLCPEIVDQCIMILEGERCAAAHAAAQPAATDPKATRGQKRKATELCTPYNHLLGKDMPMPDSLVPVGFVLGKDMPMTDDFDEAGAT